MLAPARSETQSIEDRAPALTQAERAAALIERSIVNGLLLPGARLGVRQLASAYELGVTPIREGLSRLTHRGFVVALGNRGFRVAETSRDDLEDITRVRLSLEVDALRASIEHGDDTWEARIVATLHQMKAYTERGEKQFRTHVDEFEKRHKAFHMALIGACGSRRLLDICSLLYDQAYRYRRLMFFEWRPADTHLEHAAIAELALARKTNQACQRYRGHLTLALQRLFPEAAAPVPTVAPERRRKRTRN